MVACSSYVLSHDIDGEAEEYLRALGQDNKPSDDEIERILRVEFAEFKVPRN